MEAYEVFRELVKASGLTEAQYRRAAIGEDIR